MSTIKRVYHHYTKMEEYDGGMWQKLSGEAYQQCVEAAAGLMRKPQPFRDAMMRALNEWPNSCEHNLSAMTGVNRQAWLGRAGCCLVANSPEEPTRIGWHKLSQAEQDVANQMADEVIAEWERRQITKQETASALTQPSLFDMPTPGGEDYDAEARTGD